MPCPEFKRNDDRSWSWRWCNCTIWHPVPNSDGWSRREVGNWFVYGTARPAADERGAA